MDVYARRLNDHVVLLRVLRVPVGALQALALDGQLMFRGLCEGWDIQQQLDLQRIQE